MNRTLISAFITLTVMLTGGAPAQSGNPVVKEGTPVLVKANMAISSGTMQTGDLVTFKTVQPVKAGGVVIVEKDALARGVVMFAQGAGVGHGGQLLISIDSVQTTDGSWVPLSVTKEHGDIDSATMPYSLMPAHTNGFPNGKDRVFTTAPFTLYLAQNDEFSLSSGRTVIRTRPNRMDGKMLMAANTGVLVNSVKDLSTKHVHTGDKLDFVVAAPVKVEGVTLIAKGAKAHGHAALANSSDIVGSNGQFLLSVDTVQTVDGQWVPVRASQSSLGHDNQLIRTGLGLLTPIAAILPGHNAIIKAQQTFSLVTHKSVYITPKQ